jgi:hypothetical protein
MGRDDATGSSGRAPGEGVGGLEIAATGTEGDTSRCMAVSASIVVDAELSGMAIVSSEKSFKNPLDGDDARCSCERAQVRAYVARSGFGKGIIKVERAIQSQFGAYYAKNPKPSM